MNKFTDEKIHQLLRDYHQNMHTEYTFIKKRKLNPIPVIAACLAVILVIGACLIPAKNADTGFIIIANAQTLDEAGIASADEINNDTFVEIKSDSYPLVEFNFDFVLDQNAKEYDLTQRYLFHSVTLKLNLDVVGDDIETITYKANNGVIIPVYCPDGKDASAFILGYHSPKAEHTINYDEQNNYIFCFNPVYDSNYNYERITKYYSYTNPEESCHNGLTDNTDIVISEDSDKLNAEYGWVSSFGSGYRNTAPPVATQEEIENLRTFAQADDMVGFFNYQNKIFERIINQVKIDVTVTKKDGTTCTKTLQLCYKPDEITSAEGYLDDLWRTYSKGTVCAKLV